MRKLFFAFYLLPLLLCAACTSNTTELVHQDTPQKKENQIVLIFDKTTLNSRYTWPDGSTSGFGPPFEIRYIDDHAITRLYTPRLAPERDTLVLYTSRDIVEVQHAYKGIDVLSYLFHNGDSALFTYEGRKPTASLLNRKTLDWDINYDLRKRVLISGDNFPGVVRIERRFTFKDPALQDIKDLHEREKKAREVGYAAALSEQTAELKLLDSLQQHKLLSPYVYQFIKTRVLLMLPISSFSFLRPKTLPE